MTAHAKAEKKCMDALKYLCELEGSDPDCRFCLAATAQNLLQIDFDEVKSLAMSDHCRKKRAARRRGRRKA